MRLQLVGILEDGSPRAAGVPTNPRTALTFPRGSDLTIDFTLLLPSGVTERFQAGDELRLTVKQRPTEGGRLVRLADIAGSAASFSLVPLDTYKLNAGLYSYDVWLTRAGKREPVVPLSPLVLLEADSARPYEESPRPVPGGELVVIYRSATIGYDGDPNDPAAPAILQGAQEGTFYHATGAGSLWRKATPGAFTWVEIASVTPIPFEITGFSIGTSVVEVGASVVHPSFAASYSDAPDSVELTDNAGTPPKDVSATPTAFSSDGTFSKTTNNASVTVQIEATRGADVDAASAYLYWRPRTHWGVGGAALLTEAEIEALAGSQLDNNFATTFSVSAPGPSDYVWYCFPQSYDPTDSATFQVGMFPGGFQKIGAVSVTNAHGVTQSYACWRSDFPALGSITVQVY